jgi:PhnB protein
MSTINAYLSFDNNCREAMSFYQQCLGGELFLQTVGESALADQMPPQYKDAILHSSLTKGQLVLMGSDMHRNQLVDGNTVQLCLNCENDEEMNSFFSSLSSGGKVIEPIMDMPWGAKLGELIDRYGKIWTLHYDKTTKK